MNFIAPPPYTMYFTLVNAFHIDYFFPPGNYFFLSSRIHFTSRIAW